MLELTDIHALIADDLQASEQLLSQSESNKANLINLLKNHVALSGGKRLRPTLLLLVAKAFNYKGSDHITMATVCELIHIASLLHDDVLDQSILRRGRKTANEIWGNTASILVGDFLYSHAFNMAISLKNHDINHLLGQVTDLLIQGEVLQLMQQRNIHMGLDDYLTIVNYKTAHLFAAAAEFGALLAAPEASHAANAYGLNIGIAFQIMDDLLDYQGETTQIGKNVGDDLADGKLTPPLLYILKHGNPDQIALVKQAIETGDVSLLEPIQQIILTSGALDYTKQLATEYVQKAKVAIQDFPSNDYTRALITIADFAIARDH